MMPRTLFPPPVRFNGKIVSHWNRDDLREKVEAIDIQNSESYRKALQTDFSKAFISTIYKKAISVPPENINLEIKGETRSGKSSVGIFLAKLISYWWDLEFTEDNILANQSELLYKLKEAKYGETFVVDEQTTTAFGEGVIRETEQLGMNLNICAKKCNNLIFIYPPHFTGRNAPFGLEVVSKDFHNKYIKAYYHDLRTKSFGFGGMYPRGYIILPKYQDVDYQKKPIGKWDEERLSHFKEAGYDYDSGLEQRYEKKKDSWINDIRDLDVGVREKKKEDFAVELSSDDRFLALKSKGMREAYVKILINRKKFIELTKGEIESVVNMACVLSEVGVDEEDV